MDILADYALSSAAATIRQSNSITVTAGARIRSHEPDFDTVASAIRAFLRLNYAEHLYGMTDVPSKLSSYSGKGVGHYQTASDGRADWSNDFKKYIFERTEQGNFAPVEFSMRQFERAMRSLEAAHPKWYSATMLFDVERLPIQEVGQKLKVNVSTVHRYRKGAVHFLFPFLLANKPARGGRIIANYHERQPAGTSAQT